MALYNKIGNEIPSDAVQLSEEDAVRFMNNIIGSWKIPEDVFYVKYGAGILSGLTALTGMYLNNYFRYRLRLQSFARISTYLPVVIVPAAATYLIHNVRVQQPILIEKYSCPVCVEIRSVSFQLLTGYIYPLLLAPISSFMMASRYSTYHVPVIQHDPKAVWKLYLKLSRPMATTWGIVGAVHLLAASFIAYKEVQSVATVKRKLMQLEAEFELN